MASKLQKFLSVLEAGSLRSGCQQGRVLVRAVFQDADYQFFPVSSRDRKRARELTGAPFYKGTRPSWPDPLPKALPPNTSTFGGLGFELVNWGGGPDHKRSICNSTGASRCLLGNHYIGVRHEHFLKQPENLGVCFVQTMVFNALTAM